MDKNVLFIHSRQEEIDAFRGALEGTPFVVDTTSDGKEALVMLQKKAYGVVITNRAVEGADGGTIIQYVSKHLPQTKCILNAIALNKGDLQYFINEMQVYRIFLAPVHYRSEMLPVIEEIMINYESQYLEYTEEKMKEDQLQQQKVAIRASESILKKQKEKWKDVEKASLYFVEKSLEKSVADLSIEDRERVYQFERTALINLSRMMDQKDISISEFEAEVDKELNSNGEEHDFTITCDDRVAEASESYLLTTFFVSWLIAYRMTYLTNSYIIRSEAVHIDARQGMVNVTCFLPKGTWKRQTEDMVERAISRVTLNIIEEFADRCDTVADEYEVIFHVTLPYEGKWDK